MRKIYCLIGLLFFISCKKENDPKKEEIAYRKFDTIQYVCGIPVTFKANYDNDRLISLIGQTTPVRNYYFIYNSSGQLIQRDVETGSGRQKLTEYKYDSEGQLVEKKNLFEVCPSLTEYYKYTFTYTNGKLTGTTAYKKSNNLPDYIFEARRVYSWTGDNITLVKTYDQNNMPGLDSLKLSYDLTKPNPALIFKDLWLQDIYEPPLTTILLLSKNLVTSIFFTSFDCFVNYGYASIASESRVSSITPQCLGTLWSFTYTQ